MDAYLDPSLHSENLGDKVIQESVYSAFPQIRALARIPTHRRPSLNQLNIAMNARRLYLGGSNILASHMEKHRQWLITPDLLMMYRKKVQLIGVGWWQYQGEPCLYTRQLLRSLLNPEVCHSVRDSYTAKRLEHLGFRVAMTSCPTLWDQGTLDTGSKGTRVLATVTNYKQDKRQDEAWLSNLHRSGLRVTLIPMAPEDWPYLQTLDLPSSIQREPLDSWSLKALDSLIEANDYFVGTRLHAGIRALQLGTAAVIVGVDNRAQEISRNTRLAVVPRDMACKVDFRRLLMYQEPIVLPKDAIAYFRKELTHALSTAREKA